jgi:hypothetical protein
MMTALSRIPEATKLTEISITLDINRDSSVHTCSTAGVQFPAEAPHSCRFWGERGGLISLWLYKQNNKLRD